MLVNKFAVVSFFDWVTDADILENSFTNMSATQFEKKEQEQRTLLALLINPTVFKKFGSFFCSMSLSTETKHSL